MMQRQQDVEQRARHVDPEVADGGRRGALDAADQGHGDRDAHRRREEVVRRKAGHLGEIAHGGFGRVGLPVGVGGEAGGGVPGQVGAHAGEVLRVPGQDSLQPLDGVGDHHADGGEAQHRKGVFAPVHLAGRH